MFSIATITTLLAFVSLTLADSFTTRVSTTTVTQCSTSYGKTSKTPVPTVLTTTTIFPFPFYGISTVTPTRTITPPPQTTSSTTTVQTVLTTTNMAITDVFSTTSTAFTTTTSTAVTTSTSTSTSSFTVFATETATETIPTSPGFLPAASTTPTAYPAAPPKRFMPRAEEDVSPNVKRSGGIFNLFKYPQSVKCVKTVEVLTTTIYVHTAPTTKTTTLVPATVVVQVTATTTSISTVVPAQVTVTSSFSTISTISTVATDTVTLATTVSSTESITVTSTTSLYAACTGANLFGPMVPNGYIVDIGVSSAPEEDQFSFTSTAYDCCVLCQLFSGCRGSFFFIMNGGLCLRNLGPPCTGQADGPAEYIVRSQGEGAITVSNGNCGYLSQAETDDTT